MELRLPDTLSGRTRPVLPFEGGPVRLYICGPTVYSAAHVGHARTYLHFDVARRFLETEGRSVHHVMNLTDVEDKIDQRAAALGTTPRALARREERAFFRDLGRLGILLPQDRPRASEYVEGMVAVARALERTGRVRRTGDEWFYTPPPRAPGENFLSGRDLADRAVPEPGHPFHDFRGDGRSFLVWKRQDPPRPSWRSPWGPGVPGWHLECFVMAERLLGLPVDLHGGARDLVYPHHYAANEVALELEGRPFSQVYLHLGFVLQQGAKMAKSTGNLVPMRTATAEVGAGALRWYLLDVAPGDRLEWDARALGRAAEEYAALRSTVRSWLAPGAGGRGRGRRAREVAEEVRAAIGHGLRTDRAFGHLRRWADELRREPSGRVSAADRRAALGAVRAIERRTGLPLT
ncbi:MAG TPA: class I tRNA ligase family protein [Thermoplasmata archaeon]|nr:class I tRNA ligase family protein [Thermoplasmata archaeon]